MTESPLVERAQEFLKARGYYSEFRGVPELDLARVVSEFTQCEIDRALKAAAELVAKMPDGKTTDVISGAVSFCPPSKEEISGAILGLVQTKDLTEGD